MNYCQDYLLGLKSVIKYHDFIILVGTTNYNATMNTEPFHPYFWILKIRGWG